VLLQSFVDRKTHEHFLRRDYPDPEELQRVFHLLGDEPVSREWIEDQLYRHGEELDRALDVLRIHRGLQVDSAGRFRRGDPHWRRSYEAQRSRRLTQIAEIARYADSRACRMLQLVRHFGDQEDDGRPCGLCDVCSPQSTRALRFRPPTPAEQADLERLLDALRADNGQTSGRLHKAVFGHGLSRNEHEELVGALVRAGMVLEQPASFEKDGRVIEYKRILLTAKGREARSTSQVLVAEEAEKVAPKPKQTRSRRGRRTTGAVRSTKASPAGAAEGAGGVHTELEIDWTQAEADAPAELVEALKQWRQREARARSLPAYCILNNRTLLEIAVRRPQTASELLAIKGIGPARVERHGEAILELVRR
jgi:DNA topoisomerase-3